MKNISDRLVDIGMFKPEEEDDRIICRCEEVTKGEIRKAVHDGMFTVTEVKRFLRAGMGPCQGQTCGKLVKGIIAKELGISPLDLESSTSRPPARPTGMHILANEFLDEQGGEVE